MPLLPLVLFLTLTARPDRTIPPGCNADYESCHEDCTIDYGGSTTKYRQLNQCVSHCLEERDECTTRHYSLRDSQIDPSTRGTKRELEDYERPASSSTPRDGTRRGVYRATEEEPPPRVEPAAAREPAPTPEPESEPEAAPPPRPAPRVAPAAPATPAARPSPPPEKSMAREEPQEEPEEAPAPKPAPKPVAKPSEPIRPSVPPEPKKKDISEWDPNGD